MNKPVSTAQNLPSIGTRLHAHAESNPCGIKSPNQLPPLKPGFSRVVIEVKGGVVQDVYSDTPDKVDVILVDWDNRGEKGTEEAPGDASELYAVSPMKNMPEETCQEVVAVLQRNV